MSDESACRIDLVPAISDLPEVVLDPSDKRHNVLLQRDVAVVDGGCLVRL
jgi:hypothetical protein